METLSLSEPPGPSSAISERQVDALAARYKSAYSTSRLVIGLGTFLQVMSVLAGVVVAGGVWLNFSSSHSAGVPPEYQTVVWGGVGIGVLIAAQGYVFGEFIKTAGQVLMAGLDTAVNTSTLLTNGRKVEILGL